MNIDASEATNSIDPIQSTLAKLRRRLRGTLSSFRQKIMEKPAVADSGTWIQKSHLLKGMLACLTSTKTSSLIFTQSFGVAKAPPIKGPATVPRAFVIDTAPNHLPRF